MEKKHKKKTENSAFGCLWRKRLFSAKMAFFIENRKHYLCSEVENARFRRHYLFLENGPFLWPDKITKHYKNRGFSRHMGNTKWLQKCHFGKGPQMGLYYLWYTKAVLPWKHYFYSVFIFPAKHSFAEIKSVSWKKQKLNKHLGLFPNTQRGAFCGLLIGFLGGFVFFQCFCSLVL